MNKENKIENPASHSAQNSTAHGARNSEPDRAHTSTDSNITLAKALNYALRDCLVQYPRVVILGEDIGTLGGVFRITEGLKADFKERVIDTPLAESGIVGVAIGLAMRGYRPVCEIQFDGFVYPAFDQITSQLAKIHSRTHGRTQMPVVIRIPYGGHIGAVEHHQESPEAYFAHTSGLRVVCPSTPHAAYHLMRWAVDIPDPVIFLEPKAQYWQKGEVHHNNPLTSFSPVVRPVDNAQTSKTATLVGWGAQTSMNMQVATAMHADGIEVEVIDLLSLSPIDFAPIFESIKNTGRLFVAQEAPSACSLGAYIISVVTKECFYQLKSAPTLIAAPDSPFPAAKLEKYYLPSIDKICCAIEDAIDN